MEKNKLGFNIPERPNQGDDYVTITSYGTPHNWEDDPFGEKEPAEQAPIVSELQQPLEGELLDEDKEK